MSENNNLFGKKHATLWRISMWASGMAPVVFFIFGILALWEIVTYGALAHNQYQTDLTSLLSRDFFYIVDLLLKIAQDFINGAVCFLALKGIALGLDMIVETDINYREKKVEGG